MGSRFSGVIAARISFAQSGIFRLRDAVDGVDQVEPGGALCLETPFSPRREPVKATPPLSGLFHPSPLDQSPRLQAIEQGIKRCYVELQYAVRALLDQLADLVAMPRSMLDQGQYEQFSTALFQFPIYPWLCNMF